jgi:hypothetical protein
MLKDFNPEIHPRPPLCVVLAAIAQFRVLSVSSASLKGREGQLTGIGIS